MEKEKKLQKWKRIVFETQRNEGQINEAIKSIEDKKYQLEMHLQSITDLLSKKITQNLSSKHNQRKEKELFG